jgi:hypothetical protein
MALIFYLSPIVQLKEKKVKDFVRCAHKGVVIGEELRRTVISHWSLVISGCMIAWVMGEWGDGMMGRNLENCHWSLVIGGCMGEWMTLGL